MGYIDPISSVELPIEEVSEPEGSRLKVLSVEENDNENQSVTLHRVNEVDKRSLSLPSQTATSPTKNLEGCSSDLSCE